MGGQLLGLAENAARVAAAVMVASQSGEWRLWPRPARYRMAALWYGLVPLTTRALGYLPGKLGIGEDLPARRGAGVGAMVPDARLTRRRRGVASARYARWRGDLLALSIDGDDYAPRAAVDALVALYAGAATTRRHLERGEASAALGHFGWFRESMGAPLWREAVGFLSARADAGSAAA